MNITVAQFRLKRLISGITLGDMVFIVLLIVYGLIGMRNFKLFIADIQEDNPIFYAHAFKDPSLFSGDYPLGIPMNILIDTKVATSAMVWIPALLWRYLNIDPYFPTWLLTLIQGCSMILAVYVLAIVMVRDRLAAAIAAIFAAITAPWMWGLANYGNNADWTFFPYAAQLAFAPILLAFALLIRKGKTGIILLLLVVAGLIHPALALYACTMVGLYWLWEGYEISWPSMQRRLAGLVVAVLLIILPSLWVMLTQAIDQLPRSEIIAGMRPNQHLWPWDYLSLWWFSVKTVLKWLGLAILSWRYGANFASPIRRLWLAALVGAVLLSLSQVTGAIIQNPTLITLIGLRSFCWVALLSTPLIAYYWYSHLRSGVLPGVVLSLLCLVLPFYSAQYALFWLPVIGLLVVDASQGQISFWKFALPVWARRSLQGLAWGLVVGWGISFLLLPTTFENTPPAWITVLSEITWGQFYPLPDSEIRIKLLTVILILGLLVWGATRLSMKRPWVLREFPKLTLEKSPVSLVIGAMVVIYGGWFLWSNWQAATLLSSSSLVDTLDVQLWARDHTPPSTLFLYPKDGWRTMSLRRQLSPYTRESYAYSAPSQAKEFRDRLLAFYDISPEEGERLRGDGISSLERDLFSNFTEPDFMRFASEFGATHLVLPTFYMYTRTTAFALPVVYQNPGYIVYDLRSPYEAIQRQIETLKTMREQPELVPQRAVATMNSALERMDFAQVIELGGVNYVVTHTGQELKVEGTARLVEGPRFGTQAIWVEGLKEPQTRVYVPPDAIQLDEGSFVLWARLADPKKEYSDIIAVHTGPPPHSNETLRIYIYHEAAGGFQIRYNHGVGGRTSLAITDDKWHHYAFTWKDGEQKFYIDGIEALTTQSAADKSTATQVALGWIGYPQEKEQWHGPMAGFVTFDRALGEYEIVALYLAGLGNGR